MPPNFHILTKDQMLSKLLEENWYQKLAKYQCLITPCGRHKTIKRWFDGTTTMGCVREYRGSPGDDPAVVVCLLRDGNELYSYDEQNLEALGGQLLLSLPTKPPTV